MTLITETNEPAEIRILPRGNWLDDSGKVVQPSTPEFMKPLGVEDRRPTRLDLAHWLLDPDNPMTARAQVNRFWMLFFGHGIARTLNDLGGQGEWPTHPKLLDWLAVEFIDSGWDVKHMVQADGHVANVPANVAALAGTATARSGQPTVRPAVAFPPGRRIRPRQRAGDQRTARSRQIGGPSVKPYQPAGYWQHLNFPHAPLAERFRRGPLSPRPVHLVAADVLCTPACWRSTPNSREECTAERPRSNTPQQALVLLNDPTYVEAARVLAARIVKQEGDDASRRLRLGLPQAVQREPSDAEAAILQQAATRSIWPNTKHDEAAAKALISVGDAPMAEGNPAELAAWTSVARVILNLHETITRY